MDEIASSAEPLVIQRQVSAVCRTELTLILLSSVAQGKRFSFFSGSHLGRGGLNHGCVSLTTHVLSACITEVERKTQQSLETSKTTQLVETVGPGARSCPAVLECVN